MIPLGASLPDGLRTAKLLDADGNAVALDSVTAGRPALLIFLRHFGCTGCSQQVDAIVPYLVDLDSLGVKTVLIGNGAPRFIHGFAERQRLDGYPLALLTDPTREVFALAGLDRSLWRTFGPTALLHELNARARGYFSTRKEGDVLQQGGVMLVDAAGKVVFAEAAEYASKPVAPGPIVAAAVRLAADAPPGAARTERPETAPPGSAKVA